MIAPETANPSKGVAVATATTYLASPGVSSARVSLVFQPSETDRERRTCFRILISDDARKPTVSGRQLTWPNGYSRHFQEIISLAVSLMRTGYLEEAAN